MELPRDSIERIEAAVVTEARHHTDLVREFLAGLRIQYPVAIGLLGGAVGTLFGLVVAGTSLTLTIPLLAATLVALAVVIWMQERKNRTLLRGSYVSVGETFIAYVNERDGHKLAQEAQQRQLEWTYATTIVLELASEFIHQAHTNPRSADATAGTAVCDAILGVLVDVRHRCLRYSPDDPTYNFHLFRFDETAEHLTTLASLPSR